MQFVSQYREELINVGYRLVIHCNYLKLHPDKIVTMKLYVKSSFLDLEQLLIQFVHFNFFSLCSIIFSKEICIMIFWTSKIM